MCHWVFRAMHYPCSSASPKLTSTWATLCILAKGQACSQPKAGKRKAQRLLPRNCHHSGGIDSLLKPTGRPGLKSPQIHSFDLLLDRILAGRNVELGKASLEVWLTKRDGCGSAEYPERAFSDTCPVWPVSGGRAGESPVTLVLQNSDALKQPRGSGAFAHGDKHLCRGCKCGNLLCSTSGCQFRGVGTGSSTSGCRAVHCVLSIVIFRVSAAILLWLQLLTLSREFYWFFSYSYSA